MSKDRFTIYSPSRGRFILEDDMTGRLFFTGKVSATVFRSLAHVRAVLDTLERTHGGNYEVIHEQRVTSHKLQTTKG